MCDLMGSRSELCKGSVSMWLIDCVGQSSNTKEFPHCKLDRPLIANHSQRYLPPLIVTNLSAVIFINRQSYTAMSMYDFLVTFFTETEDPHSWVVNEWMKNDN